MKKHLRIFLTAVMYFTRIPCPKWVDHSEEFLNKSAMYFPLIGWIVGGLSALILWLSAFIFPLSISIILSMISSVLITGAFHEDGFADVCDGFGGGWTKQKILEIMKDSRIGTYGVIGLILILSLKFSFLYHMNPHIIYTALIASHSLSRLAGVLIIFTGKYVRENENSKAKPLTKKLTALQFIIAAFFGIVPLFFFRNYIYLIMLIPVLLTYLYLTRYFKKWIGGYTGDCLGAVQQITEVIIYLSIVALSWKFI